MQKVGTRRVGGNPCLKGETGIFTVLVVALDVTPRCRQFSNRLNV